jgi:hypothetical protein
MTEQRGLTAEQLRELRRPFPPEAIKFKGQSASANRNKALAVPYIDARLVIARLNHVVGPDWEPHYDPTATGMWCHLEVGGKTRSDFGTNDSPQAGTKHKGMVSDALKRAAVLFGVGESVYASPSAWLPAVDEYGKAGAIIRTSGDKVKSIIVTDGGLELARKTYATWLEKTGIGEFGEPLGHGAVADASGLEDDTAQGDAPGSEGGAADLPPMPLVDVEADTLRQAARTIYEEIRKLRGGRTKLPPARFQEQLAAASTSHDALREYTAELRATVDELKGQG